jgi:leader peptidase (prepilin peptidase)/N-methyltransferase
MDFKDPLLPLWAMELTANAFLWLWLFWMGATVGSFLNVVAYRLPRRINLSLPGSFCPHCGHPIRLYDNIPILSWLALRGKCRDCGGTISPRYFVVEILTASAFLLVLTSELFLPAGAMGFATRRLLTPRDGIPFWTMYATHVVLVSTLIAAVLMRADRSIVPVRLFWPALALALIAPLIWPEVRSVPGLAYHGQSNWQIGLIDGLLGLAMGLAVGGLASLPARRKGWQPATVIALAACLGAVLGWQRAAIWFLVVLPCCDLAAHVMRLFTHADDATQPKPRRASPDSGGRVAVHSPESPDISESEMLRQEVATAPPPINEEPL